MRRVELTNGGGDMHDQIITKTTEWIEANIPEQTTQRDLEVRADASDLPDAAKQVIREIPEGEYARAQVIAMIHEGLMARLGSASASMRGFGGSM